MSKFKQGDKVTLKGLDGLEAQGCAGTYSGVYGSRFLRSRG
jgi:hypothetical protein